MSQQPPEHLGGDGDAMDDAVARLARDARRRNLARADRVMELVGPWDGSPDTVARDEAALLCHSMAGSAGTFGDDELADAARDLETVLLGGPHDRVPAALDRLRATARTLREP